MRNRGLNTGPLSGDCCCSAAAAAARNAFDVVRIVNRTEGQIVAGPAVGQFVQIGFGEHDRAGVAQRLDDGRVLRRTEAAQGGCPGGRWIVPGIDTVFDGNRQAEQRSQVCAGSALTIRVAGGFQYQGGLERDEGVQRAH